MAQRRRELTLRGLRTLRVFNAETERSGTDVIDVTGYASPNVYVMLQRLEADGFLSSRWEKGDPVKLGRPLKRLYKVTRRGREAVAQAMSDLGCSDGAK